jgi:hypothetical protein
MYGKTGDILAFPSPVTAILAIVPNPWRESVSRYAPPFRAPRPQLTRLFALLAPLVICAAVSFNFDERFKENA